MGVVEYVSDFDAWMLVALVAFKPVQGLSLMAGPGLETASRRPEGHGAEHSEGAESEEGGPFFLWRFGVGYTLGLGKRFAVAPNVDLDPARARRVGQDLGLRRDLGGPVLGRYRTSSRSSPSACRSRR